VPQALALGLLVVGVLLLCGLLAAWGMVEALAHGPNGLSWDPPLLHATATPTAPRPVAPSAAATATPTAPVPTAPPTAAAIPTDLPTTAPTPLPPTATLTVTPEPPSPTADTAQPLLGRRIALDPGHGPRQDLGAVYVDPDTNKLVLSEDVVNLDVAKITRGLLEARGATVFLTRETTEAFTTPWPDDANGDGIEHGQADDLQWRIDEMNSFGAEVFLSIHENSHSNPNKRQGIQALGCITDDCLYPTQSLHMGKLALDHLETELAAIGYPVTARELRNDLFSDGPGDPIGHLFLTGPVEKPKRPRAAEMPGTVVEALYITSPDEVQQLLQPTVRQAIARAYAGALEDYLLGK
jgi:N-acetylmuramoyl-L-alanine amidase